MKPSDRFDSLIQYYADRAALPFDLIKRQMLAESGGNPDAESPVGAVGLLQLMPATATEMGCEDRRNPDKNLRAGTEYLARQKAAVQLLIHGKDVHPDDILRLALASYNAGFGHIRAAIKDTLAANLPVTWVNVAALLPKTNFKGKREDVKQVVNYVAKILPPPPPQV